MNSNLLLKVLLVDDEPYIRQGLAAMIDWEAEGCCISGEASDGNSAMYLLQKQEFHIVISDIRMPGMDGIEFITRVKERKLDLPGFIFLSGFYDYSYARSAIQYGCSDYILKPVNKTELLDAIRRIQERYFRETGREKKKLDYEKAYLDTHLTSIIMGKYDSVNINYVRERMRLSDEITYIHCEIALGDRAFVALPADKKRGQQRRLFGLAGMLLKKYANHVLYDLTRNSDSYDIGIIYCSSMGKEKGLTQEGWMNWLLKELKERMGYVIIGCAGSKVSDISSVSDSYRDAMLIRSLRYYKRADMKYSRFDKNQFISGYQREDEIKKQIDSLIHSIEINDKAKLKAYSGGIYRALTDQGVAVEAINHDIQYLMHQLLGLAYNQDAEMDQDEIIQYVRDAIFRLKMNKGNELKFQQFTEEYSDYLVHLRQNTSKGTMHLIEAEIEEKYAENISLKYLGEKYYINSAYLGQVFKKQYGCSFKDYLNQVRIRKAAQMILRTDLRVYEIALEVGYKNIEYFVNKFEEVYEMTPSRFRKRGMQSNPVSLK